MKRIYSLFILISLTLFLASCDGEQMNQDELDIFIGVIERYDIAETNGYNYHSVQEVDDWITNADYIEQRIDSSEELKIYLEHRSIQLNHFDEHDTQTESLMVYYYFNSRIGTQIDDGKIEWETGDRDELLVSHQPMKDLSEDDFHDYSISRSGSTYTLSGILKNDAVPDVTDITYDDISEVTLTIIVENEQLIEIDLNYRLPLSTIDIHFKPFYGPGEVILPANQ